MSEKPECPICGYIICDCESLGSQESKPPIFSAEYNEWFSDACAARTARNFNNQIALKDLQKRIEAL